MALDDRVLLWAARGGCEELVEWLVAAGCAKDGGACLEAACRGDREVLGALRRVGVPWGEGVVTAAVGRGCPLPVVRWLLVEGAPVGCGEEVEAALKEMEGLGGVEEAYR